MKKRFSCLSEVPSLEGERCISFWVPRAPGGTTEHIVGTEGAEGGEWSILPEELKRRVRKFFIEEMVFQPNLEKRPCHALKFYTRVKQQPLEANRMRGNQKVGQERSPETERL